MDGVAGCVAVELTNGGYSGLRGNKRYVGGLRDNSRWLCCGTIHDECVGVMRDKGRRVSAFVAGQWTVVGELVDALRGNAC